MARPKLQLLNQRFGRLFVIEDKGSDKKGSLWLCQCDCGSTKIVYGSHLVSASVVSCGCYHYERQTSAKKHGKRHSKAYVTWVNMRQRCGNPKNTAWPSYGGRGIRVCEQWCSFEAFYADMGDPPPGMSLDRIDVNGDYSKDNCRWATGKQQARNKSDNRMIEFDGKVQSLGAWAEETGIDYYTLHSRLKRGWSIEDALTRPACNIVDGQLCAEGCKA